MKQGGEGRRRIFETILHFILNELNSSYSYDLLEILTIIIIFYFFLLSTFFLSWNSNSIYTQAEQNKKTYI